MVMIKMKKIGVLCSGGDAPGMNAALRAVVRRGIAKNMRIVAIYRGFDGIFQENFEEMTARSVGDIIQRGGTIIKTARCEKFYADEGVKEAAEILNRHNFDGLCALGGDGTFRGLLKLQKYWNGQLIGIPTTIDNDVYGTDYTVGFDTAIDTAIEALDKIRDTAESHERIFIVEVMGRDAGFIALAVGIGAGAEEILIPEMAPVDFAALANRIRSARQRGKKSIIIVVAEGADRKDIFLFSNELMKYLDVKTYLSILGHVQRGGAPSAYDRWLATRLGAFSIDCFLSGDTGIIVGELNHQLVKIPLLETQKKKSIDEYTLSIIQDLAV